MYRRNGWCAYPLLLFSLSGLFLPAFSQQDSTDRADVPLDQLLNGDGTIHLPNTTSGPVDHRGWRMVLGPGGEPRFFRDDFRDPHNPLSFTRTTPQDVSWDDRFGIAGADFPVYAIAIHEGRYRRCL